MIRESRTPGKVTGFLAILVSFVTLDLLSWTILFSYYFFSLPTEATFLNLDYLLDQHLRLGVERDFAETGGSDRSIPLAENAGVSAGINRRGVLQGAAAMAAGGALQWVGLAAIVEGPLEEVSYGQVTLKSPLHLAQMENMRTVLMGLSDDSLLMPFRKMVGQDAPGEDLGGWYQYRADYNYRKDDAGLAPSATFGQWVSALSRMYAISGKQELRERAVRLNSLYAQTIATEYYANNRFPAYCFDKLVCGLMDAHRLAGDSDALAILERTRKAALPELPLIGRWPGGREGTRPGHGTRAIRCLKICILYRHKWDRRELLIAKWLSVIWTTRPTSIRSPAGRMYWAESTRTAM
jgi:hypothetical protein